VMSLLSGRAILAAAAVALIIATLTGAAAWLRQDATQDARNEATATAAQNQERIRHECDDAARIAEREGAAGRLRTGSFFATMPEGD
jgi:predicted nicotinamide N-methyase